jgi:hypothetical protein
MNLNFEPQCKGVVKELFMVDYRKGQENSLAKKGPPKIKCSLLDCKA